jgi:predicted ribosomally synthesized peptide with SipW-like signal peptide
MINKKIILSLLTVGMLACIASGATWAYFQDTVSSTGNKLTTATLTSVYSLEPSLEPTPTSYVSFSTNDGNFGPFNADYLVPGTDSHIIKAIHVKNMGTTSAEVTATIIHSIPTDVVSGLVINVGDHMIYDGSNAGFISDSPWLVGTALKNGTSVIDASISYIYTDTDNSQNAYEGKNISFNMSIAEKAIAPV